MLTGALDFPDFDAVLTLRTTVKKREKLSLSLTFFKIQIFILPMFSFVSCVFINKSKVFVRFSYNFMHIIFE